MSSKFYSYDRRILPAKYIERPPADPNIEYINRVLKQYRDTGYIQALGQILPRNSAPTIANRSSSYDNAPESKGDISCLMESKQQP